MRERSHHDGEDRNPDLLPAQLTTGELFLQSESMRQIVVALIVVAIFALSVAFFVSIMR